MKATRLSKNEGFTLIEMCVVLAIVSLLSWLPIYQIKQYRAQQAEQLFLHQFETSWDAARQYVAIEPRAVRVMWDAPTHAITFKGAGEAFRNHKLVLPETLTVSNPAEWHLINITHNKGIKPRTLKLKSTLNNREYQYKVQMMWGVLHVQK
ncbi:competence type IV pilus minor pilin ComGD [Latilactobacillus sakei]|uniref:competence type IV pilus minor pilin ComGD n=1 Tax=Latilactobacillus sakei TaxID=1599 RepID=UPI000DC64901|nr:competence type IV pilus minor pilin ComGD [Latilactobacillus sakei]SPS03517.1 hypothetical protein LAS9624_00332 [Latilactobacillus sakei]